MEVGRGCGTRKRDCILGLAVRRCLKRLRRDGMEQYFLLLNDMNGLSNQTCRIAIPSVSTCPEIR